MIHIYTCNMYLPHVCVYMCACIRMPTRTHAHGCNDVQIRAAAGATEGGGHVYHYIGLAHYQGCVKRASFFFNLFMAACCPQNIAVNTLRCFEKLWETSLHTASYLALTLAPMEDSLTAFLASIHFDSNTGFWTRNSAAVQERLPHSIDSSVAATYSKRLASVNRLL